MMLVMLIGEKKVNYFQGTIWKIYTFFIPISITSITRKVYAFFGGR